MLSLKHEELLDSMVVAPLNEDIEQRREYVPEHEDYPERYWNVLAGDNFTYHKDRIKSRLETYLDVELSEAEYEHLTDWINTGEIETVLEVSPIIEDDEFDRLCAHPINEVEQQFSGLNKRLINALTDEEFEWVTSRLEAYVSEPHRDLFYMHFGDNTRAELWVNTEQLYTELKKYRN